jgi:aminoglycoside 6'-N-acetyltransferase I
MDEAAAVSVTVAAIRAVDAGDVAALARLRAELWPDEDAAGHLQEALEALGRSDREIAFLAFDADDAAIGFAEASLRHDYVNGTDSSPVGFLEGLYVVPAARRRGVGAALVAAVERWIRERGCAELASDALLDNVASHAAHAAYGFEETERVVYFRKFLAG